jgi:hypothetical protein
MELGFLSGLAHVDSLLLTGMAKDVYPSVLGAAYSTQRCVGARTLL